MRGEIVRLESVLANRVAARANQDPSTTPLERSSKIEKYVEVMELTKCLRRQKEFLLSENRKRQRFAEKIQQAMPVRVCIGRERRGEAMSLGADSPYFYHSRRPTVSSL